MSSYLIAGCGYVGTALAKKLKEEGHSVSFLSRSEKKINGCQGIQVDLCDPNTLTELPTCDYILYMAAPDLKDLSSYEQAYYYGVKNLIKAYEHRPPKRFILVSSTSVYGERKGEWVDENSVTDPSPKAEMLLKGEQYVTQSRIPATVIRFAGIYGPGRHSFVDKVMRGEQTILPNTTRYTNRIHRDDCANLLYFITQMSQPEDLYLGCDSCPEDKNIVIKWISNQSSGPTIKTDSNDQPKKTLNKRCNNQKIKEAGFIFRYPSYKEGYLPIISED